MHIQCVILLAVYCLFSCSDYPNGGSAMVTVVNASNSEVTSIRLVYNVIGDYPRLDSLMPGESHEFSIRWEIGLSPSDGHIEYYINERRFGVENEVGAKQFPGGAWRSPVEVQIDCRVTITIHDENYEVAGAVKSPEGDGW